MSYCVIPGCLAPQNPDSARFCLSCGAKLLLKERYRSIQPIGSGGFGRTFLAVDEDIPSKPRCVIKQLYFQSPSGFGTKKATELFYQEAVRLDELGKHPQIPTLLAHFEQNRQLYLIQEWINGQTLLQELQQKGAFNETQIWELLQDLLPVLQYIHSHRVIHRDIKPANLIRRTYLAQEGKGEEKERLVLIDFGIAKLLTHTARLHTGTIIGTPEYMAPEQHRGKVFQSSDLYSLGITCIHLLTGMSPLDLFDPVNDGWAWRKFSPSGTLVSDRLAKILDKLLQNTIAHRYQSADEVLEGLHSKPSATIQGAAAHSLGSGVGIDYTKLRNLLARKKWKQADEETWDVLCQASGTILGHHLGNSDIENLPCQDLWTINQLWLKSSGGRFGFSVQKQIYQDVGEDYPNFCDRVGWPLYNSSLPDSGLKFELRSPFGHLPSRRWVGGYSWWRHASILAAKLEQCRIR